MQTNIKEIKLRSLCHTNAHIQELSTQLWHNNTSLNSLPNSLNTANLPLNSNLNSIPISKLPSLLEGTNTCLKGDGKGNIILEIKSKEEKEDGNRN